MGEYQGFQIRYFIRIFQNGIYDFSGLEDEKRREEVKWQTIDELGYPRMTGRRTTRSSKNGSHIQTWWAKEPVGYCIDQVNSIQVETWFSYIQTDLAKNALQLEWGNFPFANWNGICWRLPLQLVQLIKMHFLPHLESLIWERKFEKKLIKKSHIQPPNGGYLIFKLPFPNGSYRNGVCRGLWAISWLYYL